MVDVISILDLQSSMDNVERCCTKLNFTLIIDPWEATFHKMYSPTRIQNALLYI